MKRNDLRIWISGLACGALAACADPAPTSTAPAALAVPAGPRLWTGGVAPRPAATPAQSAIALVGELAPGGTASLVPLASAAIGGGTLVRLDQSVDGVAVDGGELHVLVGPGGTLVAASGAIVPAGIARDRAGFVLDAAGAVARAVQSIHGVDVAAGLRARTAAGDGARFGGGSAELAIEDARARQRWFRDGAALVPAWVVETATSAADGTDTQAFRTVIAARDGRVLAQRSLTEDAFAYRVWADAAGDHRPSDGPVADFTPHPTGAPGGARPPFVAPLLISVDGLNHPTGGATDPWLAPTATETVGNNVDAYTDINAPGGLTEGDFRASTTAAGTFDRTYDTAVGPLVSTTQQQAAITQLFYTINWLHDDWYDAGFTEALANGQTDNYGRGGLGNDAVLAEAQDGANDGNRNNANMATFDEGMSPRMQVYLWSGVNDETITPTVGAASADTNGAAYGPQDFDVNGLLVAGLDGAGASTTDGCEPLTNAAAVAGNIVLLDRGNCTGKQKAVNAQAAGARGAIIMHNVAGAPAQALPDVDTITTAITIPVMSMGNADGNALRTSLGGGAVSVALHRVVGPEVDGALDNAVVAHEHGHYLHHRLSFCETRQCGAMSEGWGDFAALMMIARAGDDLTGTFSGSSYAGNGDVYFGIRRAPYSIDMTKNAFTFRLVAEGQSLPTTAPLQFSGGSNAEVHNAGEIWAESLWEAYVALQQARGAATFDEARRKMQRYIVTGLSLAPPNATFTETRDAILAGVQAVSPTDHDVLAAAFARRGLGSCALSPPRESADFVGATDSFEVKGHALINTTAVAIDVKDCDSDAALDVGETATITVAVANAGAVGLTGVSVSATTTTPGLTILTEPVVVGALASYANTTATFQVRLDAATAPTAGSVDVTVTSPGGCSDTQTVALPVRLASDDDQQASASDDFNAATSPWTPSGEDGDVTWSHAGHTVLDGFWRGVDQGTTSDTFLISPVLSAGAGPVTVAFDHVFDFELSDQAYDGGLVEISTDEGVTWTDVSTLTALPYNVVLASDSGNPLGGAMAFGGKNPSSPAPDRVTIDLGTQFANRNFRLRFRIVTDVGVGAPGWEIDNLAATGLTNKPFPTQVADGGACSPPSEDDGGCCSTGADPGPAAPIGLGLVAAALLVRRRRRL